jgi:hypothetical protein
MNVNRDNKKRAALPTGWKRVAILNEQITAIEKARAAAAEQLSEINTLPGALLRRAFNGEP